jgi:hypothetical protein
MKGFPVLPLIFIVAVAGRRRQQHRLESDRRRHGIADRAAGVAGLLFWSRSSRALPRACHSPSLQGEGWVGMGLLASLPFLGSSLRESRNPF